MAVSKEVVCQQERVHCRRCSANTREYQYVTRFYDVVATGVAAEEQRLPGRKLGQLLQALEDATRKSCDLDNGIAA